MSRILITSGPTRQYLDPVRYLTNASSGRMGAALAEAAIRLGHEVIVVSGPVDVAYPPGAEVYHVMTTEEMLAAARRHFARCDGLIGAAAPCDYRTERVEPNKIAKTGEPITLRLVETEDVVATLAGEKRPEQWLVGFALETEDRHFLAVVKLEKKRCDLIVSNGPEAMHAADNSVEIIAPGGEVLEQLSGSKETVADGILRVIQRRLIERG